MNTNRGKSWQVAWHACGMLAFHLYRCRWNQLKVIPLACTSRTKSALSNATSRLIYILNTFHQTTNLRIIQQHKTIWNECILSESCRLRLWNPHKIRTTTIFVEYVCYKMVNGYHVSLRRHRSIDQNSSLSHLVSRFLQWNDVVVEQNFVEMDDIELPDDDPVQFGSEFCVICNQTRYIFYT